MSALLFLVTPVRGSDNVPWSGGFLKELGVTRALIINCDDFGRDEYANQGIIKAFEEGILTSTSLQITGMAVKDALEYIKKHPEMDVGVHLVLARDGETWNEHGPISDPAKVPNLVDANGYFRTDIFSIQKAAVEEITAEINAQIKAAEDAGVDITHLDCHKGWCHTLQPNFTYPYLDAAKSLDVPIRWTGRPSDRIVTRRGILVADRLLTPVKTDDYEKKKSVLIETLKNLPPGVTELLIHPATLSPHENETPRTLELKLILDPDIRELIRKENIALIGWRQIREYQRKLSKE